MLYTIAFIKNQELRDIKLEGLLDPDFSESTYIYDGDFDYTAKIQGEGFYAHKSMYILTCSNWKTLNGARNNLNKVISILKKNKNSYKYSDIDGYVPVVCDITEKWNGAINLKIDSETKSYQTKMKSLKSKLVK